MRKNLRDDLKNQTIGVEVEMNSITRERAAIVASQYFGTGNYRYFGGTYHEWVAYDAQGRKWSMKYDSSISGDSEHKCELVTPILHYDDIELLQGLIRVLRKEGAKSCPSRGCGVHIHIGANGHDAKTLRNLTNIMASHETLIADSVGIGWSRLGRWCQVVDSNFLREVNAKKPTTMEGLADVWYQSQGCDYGRDAHYNSSRYHMLNLHATFTKGTVEFRAFQFDDPSISSKGGLHAGKLKAYIQFCLAISNYAKTVRYASPEEPVARNENPRYVMRLWLKNLGLVGDEFKTCRLHMMSRLDGSGHGRYCYNASNVGRVA